MYKNVLIGLFLLAVIVGGGLGWYYLLGPQGIFGEVAGQQFVVPRPLRLSGFGGLTLGREDLGAGFVPVVTVPLDLWGGYAALLAANGGSEPSRDSFFYREHRFAVRIVREDSNTRQLEGFVAGRYHFIWAGMDALPLLYDALKSDRRVVPQVVGLFDWSLGGDGIVVRDTVQRSADLRGRVVLTSQANPYPFLLLWYLAQVDVDPRQVRVVHLDDTDGAFRLFRDTPDIAAWVTWEPYLSRIPDPRSESHVPNTRLLINSRDVGQLIADVMVTRADLVRDHPAIVRGMVEGLLFGEQILRQNPARVHRILADFYELSGGPEEARALLEGIHIPNLTEAREFFRPENPVGAQKIFYMAHEYYRMLGILDPSLSLSAEQVLHLRPFEEIASGPRYRNQPNRLQNLFVRPAPLDLADLEKQRIVLSGDIKLSFEAQRVDFDLDSKRPEIRENIRLLGKVAEQLRILGGTTLRLIGHLDTSRVEEFRRQGPQAFVEASAQAKLLSKQRAEFVKRVLVQRFGINPARIVTEGRGWDQPVEPWDAAANRRVEVLFVSHE